MKVPTTRLLLVTDIWDGKPSHRKSLARNFLVWSDLTFGPLLQGQMRTAKLKSAYNSLCPPPWGVDILFLLFSPSDVRCPMSDVRCPASDVRRHAWFPLI